jgi:hypothetical protein
MTEHVTGEFELPEAAAAALEGLIDDQIDADEISVSVENPSGLHLIAVRQADGLLRSALVGVATGVAVGAALAALVVFRVVHHPELAAWLDGPAAGLLRGAALGGMAGFFVGLLGHLLLGADRLTVPPASMHPGKVTVAVDADAEHAQHAREVLRRCGAGHVAG